MEAYTNRTLEWIRRNRQPTDAGTGLGPLVEELLGERVVHRVGQLSELRRALAAATDESFRLHCTLGELRGGQLTVLVDDPSLACPMRDRWLVPLRELLGTKGRRLRVSSIRFVTGRSDLRLDEAESNPKAAAGPGETDGRT